MKEKAPTPNRVRSIYMDFGRRCVLPGRGDRIRTNGETLYWVLCTHRVRRKDPAAPVRIAMGVITSEDIEEELKGRLLRSALRRGSSILFRLGNYVLDSPNVNARATVVPKGNHEQHF